MEAKKCANRDSRNFLRVHIFTTVQASACVRMSSVERERKRVKISPLDRSRESRLAYFDVCFSYPSQNSTIDRGWQIGNNTSI